MSYRSTILEVTRLDVTLATGQSVGIVAGRIFLGFVIALTAFFLFLGWRIWREEKRRKKS